MHTLCVHSSLPQSARERRLGRRYLSALQSAPYKTKTEGLLVFEDSRVYAMQPQPCRCICSIHHAEDETCKYQSEI